MDQETEPLHGTATDPYDAFLVSWGMETYKQSIPRLEAALQRVITLSSALLGGTIYFVNGEQLPAVFRALAMGFFLGSLSCALAGFQFHNERVCLDEPETIERFKNKIIAWRAFWCRWSMGLLWSGLVATVTGVLMRLVGLA